MSYSVVVAFGDIGPAAKSALPRIKKLDALGAEAEIQDAIRKIEK